MQERVRQVNSEVETLIEQSRLLGEIELTDEQRRYYRELVRDLSRCGRDPLRQVPDAVAILTVDIARRRSDGRELWPFVFKELVPDYAPTPADQGLQRRLGNNIEQVLRKRHLPTFQHLLEQGARRYLAPVLGHALLPEALVDAYMDKVIRPAIERGWGTDEVQEWLVDNPPAGLPRAVERFIVHGGTVATDLVDRTITYAQARLSATPDSGDGLPVWLRRRIDDWCDRNTSPTRVVSPGQRRTERPVLRFDYGANEVVVDLPYTDKEEWLRWQVTGPAGVRFATVPAFEPLWARTARRRSVAIDRPVEVLRVRLIDHGGAPRETWLLPSLSADRPALFFAPTNGRARTPGEFLNGDSWFILHPESAVIGPASAVETQERLGSPFGWDAYVVSLVHVSAGQALTTDVDGTTTAWRLRAEEPRARFEEAGVMVASRERWKNERRSSGANAFYALSSRGRAGGLG